MTSQEKETTINFNEGDEIATVYTYNSAMKRKLAAFAAAYPDLCRVREVCPTGAITYEIAKDRISVNFKKPLTEKERKILSERALKNNSANYMNLKRDLT
ncbi:MAG: molecular chaperone [Clostridia bacterium]|jgi:hypothetical protein|nr:molecular chaperone [Clostridia bacterium]